MAVYNKKNIECSLWNRFYNTLFFLYLMTDTKIVAIVYTNNSKNTSKNNQEVLLMFHVWT